MSNEKKSGQLKRIALFSTNFVLYSQTFVFDEVSSHERYEVDVFSHNRLNSDQFAYNPVYALNSAPSLLAKLEWVLYGLTTYSPSHMKRIRTGGYALLHAHFGPGAVYALTYKRVAGAPLVVTFHGYDVPLLLTSRRLLPAYWRYWWRSSALFQEADCLLAASSELCDLLITLGVPEKKVKLWRLGVQIPPGMEEGARTGKNVLMVGRFVEKKGFEYGLRAINALLRSGMDCNLHIVGDGPRRSNYDRIIAQLDMGGRVHLLGIKPHREVLSLMDRMDILLAPSVVAANGDRESGLLVVKEASARGIPVVGTWHGGIPEIIEHAKTGFLVPERNPAALAAATARLLRDETLRKRLGRAGRKKMMAEYNIVDRVRALEEIYDEAIADYAEKNRSN